MAVKSKKETPKPTGPQKIEEQDLNNLKQLQKDTDALVYNLGQLAIQKQKMADTESELKKAITIIDKREEELGKQLSDKYGVGTVNIEEGTFTPRS